MEIYQAYSGMYKYRHLAMFAEYLLKNHVREFTKDQLELSRKINVPLLQRLAHMTDAQILELSEISIREYFSLLANNKGQQYIEITLNKWHRDQLTIVGKFEIMAEDITAINYVRATVLKKWARRYGKTAEEVYELSDEIDNFLFGSTTSATNLYIDILKGKIEEKNQDLEKREYQLLQAQAIAHIGSFEWDLINDQSIYTPELSHIFEFKEQQPFGEFVTHVHPEDREKLEKEIAMSLVTGEYNCEYRYRAPSGEKTIWARGIVIYKEGKPAIMRGTIQDITQRKKVETELIEKTIELQRRNENLQHFASIASHDLKEPLRKIALFSDMVLSVDERNLSESSKNNLKKARESSRRMQRMIEDILNFSSIKNEEQKQCTKLQIIINEVLELLEEVIKEKNATIIKHDLPEASVIPSQFRQLFQNLITNAIKFSKDDIPPVITIEHAFIGRHNSSGNNLTPSDKYLQIKIRDNGIGFEEKHSEKIFELFGRLHPKSAYEGSGLGLSICKKIVENHGGVITAESNVGKGSIFSITIPVGDC